MGIVTIVTHEFGTDHCSVGKLMLHVAYACCTVQGPSTDAAGGKNTPISLLRLRDWLASLPTTHQQQCCIWNLDPAQEKLCADPNQDACTAQGKFM
jgi:hypothetical protein